jgi:hypothetical protein
VSSVSQSNIAISGNVTTINQTLNIGTFSFQSNPGLVTLIDVPIINISGTSGSGQAYALNIGGQTLLQIYCEPNGVSGIQNTQIILGSQQSDKVNFIAGASGSAPSSGSFIIPVSTDIFGGSNGILGTPVGWLDILVSGLGKKIPYY